MISFDESVYALMFTTGLLGGVGHCSGMCGPLAIALAPRFVEHKWRAQLLMNLGRLLSYAFLGGILAAAGAMLGLVAIAGLQQVTLIVAGLVMIVGGLITLGVPGLSRLVPKLHSPLSGGALKLFANARGLGAAFSIGIFWGLLPCGLLYSAFVAAIGAGADAGHPVWAWLKGASILFLFGLGTLPTVMGIGVAASSMHPKLRAILQRVAGLIVVVTGVIFIVQALYG